MPKELSNKEKVQCHCTDGIIRPYILGQLKRDFIAGKLDFTVTHFYVPSLRASFKATLSRTKGFTYHKI